MSESFGERLARLRKSKGMTQEDIAKKVTISPQAVSKWENDISSPDISILGQLADIFGVSVDELLGRENSESVSACETCKESEGIFLEDEEYDNEDDEEKTTLDISDGKSSIRITKGNLEVKDEDGSYVSIGKDGVHVVDGSSDESVHIDGEGIEVREHRSVFDKVMSIMFPVLFGVAIVAFIIVGIFWKNYGWKVGWLFLLIPLIVCSFLDAIRKRRFCAFLYPIFVTVIYLFFGFLTSYGWGLWWLFITIPAYYIVFGPIDGLIHSNGH